MMSIKLFDFLLIISTFQATADWNLFGGSKKQSGLPDPPVKVLLSKKIKGLNSAYIAFNGNEVVFTTKNNVSVLNIDDGSIKNYKLNKKKFRASDVIPIFVTNGEAHIQAKDSIYVLSKTKKPRLIKKFKSRISWVEKQADFALLKTKKNTIAILSEGKVKEVDKTSKADIRLAGKFIEAIYSKGKKTVVKRFSKSGLVTRCELPYKNLRFLSLSNNATHAVALKPTKSHILAQGFDCKTKKRLWSKPLHGGITKRIKGPIHHFNTNQNAIPSNCGDQVCLNLVDSQTTYGGSTESGLYCLDPKTGTIKWKYSRLISNDVPNRLNRNIVAPAYCFGGRVVTFMATGDIVLTQKFPFSSAKAVSYIENNEIKKIRGLASSRFLFTSPTVTPVIADQKIAFTTGSSYLVILGK